MTGDDSYSFFDANDGGYTDLNSDELMEKIDLSSARYSATELLFLDAKAFVNSYQIAKKEIEDEVHPVPQI